MIDPISLGRIRSAQMPSIAPPTSPFLSFSRALNPNYDPSNPGAAPLYADGSQASRSLTEGWYDGHETEYFKSVITSLDNASSAEKGSFQWAYARAAAQLRSEERRVGKECRSRRVR